MKNQHELIVGQSGTGKSYYVQRQLTGPPSKRAVYFNTQGEDVPRSYVTADWDNHLDRILMPGRVNYVPQPVDETAKKELAALVDRMFELPRQYTLAVDEAQAFAPQGGSPGPLQKVVRRGRKEGVTLWAVTQHPSEVDKVVLRQCTRVVLFPLPYSDDYLRRYRIPADELQAIHSQGGAAEESKYPYAVYEQGELSGPFQL